MIVLEGCKGEWSEVAVSWLVVAGSMSRVHSTTMLCQLQVMTWPEGGDCVVQMVVAVLMFSVTQPSKTVL